MKLEDIDFDLPQKYIAQDPIFPRDHSKLFVYDGKDIEHRFVYDLPKLLTQDTEIFFNDTKVVKARIYLKGWSLYSKNGNTSIIDSGEIFFLTKKSEGVFDAMLYPGKKYPVGTFLISPDGHVRFDIVGVSREGRIVSTSQAIEGILDKYGSMPLPPYLVHDSEKELYYQTLFAEKKGSVAAPTASLHFTHKLLGQLSDRGVGKKFVTLHVGLGTFKPLKYEIISDNELHVESCFVALSIFSEIYEYASMKKNILAVGTTVCRVLESLPYLRRVLSAKRLVHDGLENDVIEFWNSIELDSGLLESVCDVEILDDGLVSFNTKLYIYPGFTYRIVNSLMTNFHLPKSSLLLLVGTFLGNVELLLQFYEIAKKKNYRFYSFGDAMLLLGLR